MDSTRLRCPNCGTVIGEEFARCPICHHVSPGRATADTSPANVRLFKLSDHVFVPWYRREPRGFVFLLAIFFAPVTIALCVLCLTGDIYTRVEDSEGKLKVWGVGNKFAAVVILLIQGFVWWAVWRMKNL